MASECLVSKGYTNAEKALAANYATGDVVAFHRPYKRVGAEKGDECRVIGVDHKAREVLLEDGAMRPLGAARPTKPGDDRTSCPRPACGRRPAGQYLTVKRLPRKRRSSRRQSKVRRLSPR